MYQEQFLDHTPLTEEEALGLFQNGDYPAVFEKIEIKNTKSGTKCFVGDIRVIDPAKNKDRLVTLWFSLPYLLKHAYEAAGLESKYQENKLSNKDLIGKKVIARVKIRKGSDEYPMPSNIIYDFIVPMKAGLEKEFPFNDVITF